MTASIALLVMVLATLVWRAVNRDRRDYVRFKRLRSTAKRRAFFRRWTIESWVVLGGMAVLVLVAAWEAVGPVLADAASSIVVSWLPEEARVGVVIGVVVALLAGLVVPVLVLRGQVDEVPTLGDIQALLPRNRGELPYGAALAVTAGVVEETLFRLALPALVFQIVPDGLLAFGVCALVFGLLHLYQGTAGVIATLVLGVLLTLLYLLSGSILLVILLHVAFDLRSLVLIPVMLRGAWAPAPAAPTRPQRM